MPQLPDIQSLGTPPVPQPGRGVYGYRAGQAAEGMVAAGRDIQQGTDELKAKQDDIGIAFARSHLLTSTIEAQKAAELQADPVKAELNYNQAKQAALEEATNMIPAGSARTLFTAAAGDVTRYMDMSFGQNLVVKKENIAIGKTYEVAQKNMQAALNAPDEETATQIIDNTNNLYKSLMLTAPTRFTPVDEVEQRTKWISDYSNQKIQSFLSRGDAQGAQDWYGKHSTLIPGHMQMEIEKSLHSSNMQKTGNDNADAFLGGAVKPPTVGAPPTNAQAAVADAAHAAGHDVNDALTVLRIESNNGQNVGKIGNIGQTKITPAGATLEQQAADLVKEKARANDIATQTLGRPAEPWEGYVVYQQGSSGGPALLKAADDPAAKAVDVLSPLYKSQKQATQAIVANGGNVSMSAGQFLDFIKQKYFAQAARAAISLPTKETAVTPGPEGAQTVSEPAAKSPGAAITDQHAAAGEAVQPAATPVQQLLNLDKVYPDALMRANAIPNIEERESTLKALEQKHTVYQAAANAWKTNFQNQAQNLAMDPKFTSIDMIPPDMRSALADNPITMNYLETRANYNLEHAGGANTKDMREYGTGFYDLFKAVHAAADTPGRITDITQLQSHVGKDGDLTMAGYDKLSKELEGRGTPEGSAEGEMKKAFFAAAKAQISGKNEMLGIKDPKGEMLFAQFLTSALPAYEQGRKAGKSPVQLLDEKSPDYIGKGIASFRRPQAEQLADMMQDFSGDSTRSLDAIVRDVQSGKLTKEAGKAEAMKLKLIRNDLTPVPHPE